MTVEDEGIVSDLPISDLPIMTLPIMAEVWQSTVNWQPTPSQSHQFQRLYDLVVQSNRQFNLTRITEPQEFWEKHLWDSLRGIGEVGILELSEPCPAPYRVIDIGSGAGFPGVPVAIAHPDWTVTLLDSTRKKTVFLDTLVQDLGLHQVKSLTDRAEQLGQQLHHRAAYDLALIRAVASASVCAEYTLPLLRLGGVAVLYRGQWTDEEDQALPLVAEQLGGAVERVAQFTTPLSHSVRHCIYLRKTAQTPPHFPRPIGIPAQNPL